jgi:hypothetical protein
LAKPDGIELNEFGVHGLLNGLGEATVVLVELDGIGELGMHSQLNGLDGATVVLPKPDGIELGNFFVHGRINELGEATVILLTGSNSANSACIYSIERTGRSKCCFCRT